MDNTQRIAQFENMALADPTNEMAHFSLAGAYMQAGRYAEAADSYLRCTQLVPDMSKAFQLAGDALLRAGNRQRAVEVLTEGHAVASRRGDLMPAKAIADLLRSAGAPVPEAPAAAPPANTTPAPAGAFVCARSGRPGVRLARPPFRGPVGEWIGANISRETWTAWIGQGTKVINELRLDLSRDKDQEVYDQHMREFLGIDEKLYAELTRPR